MNIQDEFENFEAGMEGHETALHIFEAGAKAMLEHVRGKQEPVAKLVAWHRLVAEAQEIVESKSVWKKFIDGTPLQNDIAVWMADFAEKHTHPAPAVAQEPVHFRAVLCREQQDQAHGVVPKVVGFVDKKAVEQFILEKRDFQGWRYNLEPLYTTPPAAEVNAWEHHAKKLTQWLHCMSHNDSYFGEPAGLVKQVTHELYRLIGTTDDSPPTKVQHPDDVAVDNFAVAMKEKLALARDKGRGGWEQCSREELSAMLHEHVAKGDPRDVANFCMFLWSLRQPIIECKSVKAAEVNAQLLEALKDLLYDYEQEWNCQFGSAGEDVTEFSPPFIQARAAIAAAESAKNGAGA